MRTFFLLISILVSLFLAPDISAQNVFPEKTGDVAKYTTLIEMKTAYISGVCILSKSDDKKIYGSIFNEFGITAIDFSYDEKRQKVKLHNVIKMLDRWYIRYTLKGDLKRVLYELKNGNNEYENKKRGIKYSFTSITSDSIQ